MTSKKTAVFGIYKSRSHAEHGVDRLLKGQFSHDDISVLLPEAPSSRDFAHEKGTKAPEGATAGGATGGVIGGALGLLVGVGALAIPGAGPLIAAGPIMATLAGVGAGGTVGGLIGALVGVGVPEYEAKRYEGRIQEGGILVSVHCDTSGEIARAKELMKESGGQHISSSGEASADLPAIERVEAPRAAGVLPL